MWNICQKCGQYRADKMISKAGTVAVCPECGQVHPFKRLPLFVLTGASGSGKSQMAMELSKIQNEIVVIECDIFWRAEFHNVKDDFLEFREFCLRAAKNISQSGRPVILCGAAIPVQYDACIERRYFSDIFYLGLICDEAVLEKRLKERPAYRKSGSDEFIFSQKKYNQFLRELALSTKEVEILDVTKLSISQTANEVLEWLQLSLNSIS